MLKELAKKYDETVKTIKELEARKEELKAEIIKETGGAFKNEFITVAVTPDGQTESVDKEAMKRDGIYDRYKCYVPRKMSEKITVKLEKISEPDIMSTDGFRGVSENDDLPY